MDINKYHNLFYDCWKHKVPITRVVLKDTDWFLIGQITWV